jgi:hypothetical protein
LPGGGDLSQLFSRYGSKVKTDQRLPFTLRFSKGDYDLHETLAVPLNGTGKQKLP